MNKVGVVETIILNRWKEYFPKINKEQSLICDRLACLNLNGYYSEGSVKEYVIENNLFNQNKDE